MPSYPASARVATVIVLTALSSLVGSESALAQEVRGRLLASPGDRPLAGAYFVLLDADGRLVTTTLSNAAGWFSLAAGGEGLFTVRAEHVGYATREQTVRVVGGAVTWLELRTDFQAIELEGLTAEVDKACSLPAATALRLATLWDEVGKAFRVTRYVEEQGAYLFDVERWTRTLEPTRLRVVDETRRPRAGMHAGSPFVSLPPDRLAVEGYVQGEQGDDQIRYYGPDARVLLDPTFQAGHCFALVERAPEDGWVGLAFRPRDLRARDIEGTLWIDRSTYEPRRLDFRYEVLPWPLETDLVGGRVEFARLPEGPWIVRRWYLRMPVVGLHEVRLPTSSRREERYTVASLIEEGGEVVRAQAGEVALAAKLGAVEGTVLDSVTGRPTAGAVVRVQGTFLGDTTDTVGRFRIEEVPDGRYVLAAGTAALRALAFDGGTAEVDVTGGGVASVEILLPSEAAVVAARCDAALTEHGTGVVLGTVLSPGGLPVPGGSVQVTWDEVQSVRAGAGRGRTGREATNLTVGTRAVSASVPVAGDGHFVACGLPEDIPVELVAVAPEQTGQTGQKGTPLQVRIGSGALTRVELPLEAGPVAEALVVTVTGPDGRTPVEAARVSLPGLGRTGVTDAAGSAVFPQIPVGPLTIEVSHLAYLSRADALVVAPEGRTVARVGLSDRALELDPITVEVHTPEAREERARGASGSVAVSQVRIREMITGARANNVVDVLRAAMPTGVKFSPLVHNDTYVGTCIESTRGGPQRRGMGSGCAMVQVVLDGGYLTTDEAARLVESFPLLDIVSVEFLSPMDQTFRYGTQQATGMLIIRTSRGGGRD